jgi:hypothetical protein
MKKFEPWIQKADAKRAVGMLKPRNLQEALDQQEGANVSFSTQLLSYSPEKNFTHVTKTHATQPHIVENRGITMAPLFLRLIS